MSEDIEGIHQYKFYLSFSNFQNFEINDKSRQIKKQNVTHIKVTLSI